jgi:hypothetical protein
MSYSLHRGRVPVPVGLRSLVVAALALASVVLGLAPTAARAQDQRVILRVTGDITKGGADHTATYTLASLEKLGTTDLTTKTPFTPQPVHFTGVLLRTLLKAVGAQGTTLHAMALNDYAVDVPIADVMQYDVLLATRIDGEPMRIREKGPLWIIYPWSQDPALAGPVYESRSIGQVRSLDVR